MARSSRERPVDSTGAVEDLSEGEDPGHSSPLNKHVGARGDLGSRNTFL